MLIVLGFVAMPLVAKDALDAEARKAKKEAAKAKREAAKKNKGAKAPKVKKAKKEKVAKPKPEEVILTIKGKLIKTEQGCGYTEAGKAEDGKLTIIVRLHGVTVITTLGMFGNRRFVAVRELPELLAGVIFR